MTKGAIEMRDLSGLQTVFCAEHDSSPDCSRFPKFFNVDLEISKNFPRILAYKL